MDVTEGGESELGQASMKKAEIPKYLRSKGMQCLAVPLWVPLYTLFYGNSSVGGFLRFIENSFCISASGI